MSRRYRYGRSISWNHQKWNGSAARGIDAYKENITLWNSILSDMHTNIDAILAEGDKVAIHVTNTGTHTGTLFGIPATMKQIKFSLTAIMRIADGKLIEAPENSEIDLEDCAEDDWAELWGFGRRWQGVEY